MSNLQTVISSSQDTSACALGGPPFSSEPEARIAPSLRTLSWTRSSLLAQNLSCAAFGEVHTPPARPFPSSFESQRLSMVDKWIECPKRGYETIIAGGGREKGVKQESFTGFLDVELRTCLLKWMNDREQRPSVIGGTRGTGLESLEFPRMGFH